MTAHQATLLLRRARRSYVTTPVPPVGLAASNITSTGATLTWSAVPTADTYRLQRSLDQTAWTDVATTAATTVNATGLAASTVYYFRVSAANEAGRSGESETVTLTTSGVPNPPATPSAPTAGDVTETTITLTWPAVTGAASYTLQRAPGGTTTWATVYTGAGPTFVDSGLTALTSYAYRVSASNADGTSAYSPTTTVTTDAATQDPPAAPAIPRVTDTTTTSIALAWDAVATATAYTLQRSLNGTTGWTTVSTAATVARTDTGLTPATTYHYRVSASNAAGTSAFSPTRTTSTTSGSNPTIRPVSGLSIRSRSGTQVHANRNQPLEPWKVENADAICSRLAAIGLTNFRGLYPLNDAVVNTWVAACRRHGIKWHMSLIPESGLYTQTFAETRQKVIRVREEHPDICAGLEGVNEPNDKGGNWSAQAVAHQEIVWESAKSTTLTTAPPLTIPIVGPSLLDTLADASYDGSPNPVGGPRHQHQLLDNGVLNYQNYAGLHTYPSGDMPLRKLDAGAGGQPDDGRLDRIYNAYGANYPVASTEWGYHNDLTFTRHRPASEAAAGTYAPRGYLQFLTQIYTETGRGPVRGDMRLMTYEFLDDFDDRVAPTHEYHFGIFAVGQASRAAAADPATWRRKPFGDKLAGLLDRLRDPAGTAPYTPPLVVCDVSTAAANANLQWQVTATKAQADAGTASVWVWRNLRVWNPDTLRTETVLPVSVTIRDRVGNRTVQVDAEVQEIVLR